MTEQAPPRLPMPIVNSGPSTWVIMGWICAFMFPLAGFVIGFCLPRKDSQQGVWIMATSVVVVCIVMAVYSH